MLEVPRIQSDQTIINSPGKEQERVSQKAYEITKYLKAGAQPCSHL